MGDNIVEEGAPVDDGGVGGNFLVVLECPLSVVSWGVGETESDVDFVVCFWGVLRVLGGFE